ncbi:putative transporter or flippase transmembrane protein [Scheffersomyces xylosifermentans]|uniref:putative transporter or flippase transmembrane protein n=1 Tax=Scheffersomyces xylosifermentans TaxID=1304137 RepID=UPI00315D697E
MVNLGGWSTTSMPTKTTITSIEPTLSSSISTLITSLTHAAAAKGIKSADLMELDNELRGARASWTIIKYQQVLATATNSAVKAQASKAIFEATVNLDDYNFTYFNQYGIKDLSTIGNYTFLCFFGATCLFTLIMMVKSRYHWFNISFVLGLGLETLGYVARVMSMPNMSNMNLYLIQLVCLTIAPAFVMAGIYYLFAQLVVVHGRQFSFLKPMWYSYLFMGCDFASLFMQSAGGAIASSAAHNNGDSGLGRNIMVAGMVFQVVAMSAFLIFWFIFLRRVYFKHGMSTNIRHTKADEATALAFHSYGSTLWKASISNFFKLLFNTSSARKYKVQHLELFYNSRFAQIRGRPLYNWFPLAMSIAVFAIYIRCVYRVVELSQGFDGYFMTHELYLFALDSFLVAVVAIIFVPFNPFFVLGPKVTVSMKSIKHNLDAPSQDEKSEGIQENTTFLFRGDDLFHGIEVHGHGYQPATIREHL